MSHETAIKGLSCITTDVDEFLDRCGLDFEVEQRPAAFLSHDGTPIIDERHRYNVRTDTLEPLGPVGLRYVLGQNRQIITKVLPISDMVRSGQLTFERGGILDDGRKCFAVVKSPMQFDILPGDSLEALLCFRWSHTGASGVSAYGMLSRSLCENLFSEPILKKLVRQLNEASSGSYRSVRHVGDIEIKLDDLRRHVEKAEQRFQAVADSSRRLADVQFKVSESREYVEKLWPRPEQPGRARTIWDNRRSELNRIYGSDTITARGTWWALYNTVSEYLTHGGTTRGKTDNARAENRFNSVLDGEKARLTRKAFALALEYAENAN